MVNKYGKLIRDNIPEIIRSNGQTPVVRELSDDEYRACLNEKLLEEVREYLVNNCVEELCDIMEVAEALAAAMGCSAAEMHTVRAQKALTNGRFEKKLLLEEVIT